MLVCYYLNRHCQLGVLLHISAMRMPGNFLVHSENCIINRRRNTEHRFIRLIDYVYRSRLAHALPAIFKTEPLPTGSKVCYILRMSAALHNRRYKDSVFVDLFSEDKVAKENFLSLYNALHNTHLNNVSALIPLRLEQVMYMSFYNDVSYLVDNKMIILAEHQSTINPKMPIRCLEYVVRLYERILDAQ